MNPPTRDRILKIAFTLFCQRGFHAVSTQDICRDAGVLKGSLYHFFPSKIDIVIEALVAFGERVRVLFETAAASPGSWHARLRAVFEVEHRSAQNDQAEYGKVLGCLIRFENRMLVLFQWFWNYLTRNRAARLITGSRPPEARMGNPSPQV